MSETKSRTTVAKARLGRVIRQGRPNSVVGPRKLGIHIPLELPPHVLALVRYTTIGGCGAAWCGRTSVVGTCNAVWGEEVDRDDRVIQV